MALLVACGWLAVVVWLIGRAVGQRGFFPLAEPVPSPSEAAAPRVTVIVPARDEEGRIETCLRSLTQQDYPADRMLVLAIDDHSSDDTFAIASSLAERDRRIRVLRSPTLPPGWVGKSHACWIGARAAPVDTEWLCFMDADVRAEPALIASAVATAAAARLDLLSLMPRQELGSFAERVVMPCGLYLMAVRQDLGDLQSRDGEDTSVTGQFMLTRNGAYRAVGGHAAVRSEICEDVALGRLIKRSGRRVALYDGKKLVRARMYTGWRTLWIGVSKNLTDMLGGPLPTVLTALAATVLAWAAFLVPTVYAADGLRGSLSTLIGFFVALAGSAAVLGLHIAGASYFRIPFWYGLLFPIGYTAGAAMAIDSVLRRLRGRVVWKGRTYP